MKKHIINWQKRIQIAKETTKARTEHQLTPKGNVLKNKITNFINKY